MSKNPKTIPSETLALVALELMEKHNITSLFVYSSPDLVKPDGIVHIHDIRIIIQNTCCFRTNDKWFVIII